jgi:MacB-like periplasmic core domain
VHHRSIVAGIILQIALATALVTNGAIVVRTVLRLQDAPLGLNPKHLLAFSVALPSAQYDTPEKCKVFEERFAREASELGALESISYNDIPPLVDIGPRQSDFQMVGQNPREAAPQAYWQDVGADYFKVMEISLKRGRLLTRADIANKVSVTVIDEQLAAEFFPGEDPIGKQIGDDTPLTIVGVVGSSKHGSYAGGREFYQIYCNNLPDVGRPMWFLAKAKGDPWAVVRDLQNVLSSINLDLAMFNLSTMEDILGNTLRTHRLVETIVSIFACLSFALALVGLYGVVAAAMARREMELAIRMALGATPNKILMLILRNFLVVLSLGLCAGSLLAVAVDKLMQSLPARLGNFEPVTCALVCIALGLASTVAGLIPCRGIAQIQPASLLRG